MESYFNQATAMRASGLSLAILSSILAVLIGFPRFAKSKRALGAR